MSEIKVKLTSQILIDGEFAHPEDKNKGIYSLKKAVAKSLIHREKAVLLEDAEENQDKKNKKQPQKIENEISIERLKEIAQKIDLKYNPNTGYPKLLVKVTFELEAMAKELKVEIVEGESIELLYNKIEKELENAD